jgi:hypothetical protein
MNQQPFHQGKIVFDKQKNKTPGIIVSLILILGLFLILIAISLVFKDYTRALGEPRIPEGLLIEVKRLFNK